MDRKIIKIGLDIGSVSVKLAAVLSGQPNPAFLLNEQLKFSTLSSQIFATKICQVFGNPQKAAINCVMEFVRSFPEHQEFEIQVTGSHGSSFADSFKYPFVNEYKAISHGTILLVPGVRTILEIGGDASRYIRVNDQSDRLTIIDYERNGDCAAGTGSFIDQQALRLNYSVDQIGSLVLNADRAANIAGRCSVFAKSDMIHAQQRGYSPGAIFKGLCEAVVRNYKGTVLRGKELKSQVVFIGGVAGNQGVVSALEKILGIEDLKVPELYNFAGALGCIVISGGVMLQKAVFQSVPHFKTGESIPRGVKLDDTLVEILDEQYSGHFRTFPVPAYLGIDVGSVSTNLALLDEDGMVFDSVYTSTEGRPVQVVQRELKKWAKKWSGKLNILGVGTTGSGRELIGALVGADVVHDEITAHKTGADFIARRSNKKVDTIFEIGGQDSKFISIEDGVVVDFTMNEACAAGTGSFLEEQAHKLGISIKDQFTELAMSSLSPVKMGERCTVFMEKDVTAFLRQGIRIEDITAGLAMAVVQNYLNRVVRERKIGENIFFQGGTAYNKSVAAAFATTLEKKITVPPHNGVIGAVGAALLAKKKTEHSSAPSRFFGFDLEQVEFEIKHFTCKSCSNQCEIQQITVAGEKTFWGDKCSEKYRGNKKLPQKPVLPDLVQVYHQLLFKDIPNSNSYDLSIGIPRSMYFYDRFPFWRAYFAELGVELVLSDVTNRRIIEQAREGCIAEPCFPVILAHGHVMDLFTKDVDYVFSPVQINSETDTPETFSWFCPWGQTNPLVIKNSLRQEQLYEKLLTPVIEYRFGKNHVQKSLQKIAKILGISAKHNRKAVDFAYAAYDQFRSDLKRTGEEFLRNLRESGRNAIVLVGRPYNIYDAGVNLNIPTKLREQYGIDVIPMDFLPMANVKINHIHENMFWNYGRKILQACRIVGENRKFSMIYFSNFKCGPDSYIKHFVRRATGEPFLVLQFDDHSNDAGMLTRCEAFLQSKNMLKSEIEYTNHINAVQI
ncbi:hypothetical protein JW935_25705 [candidate division KSB1 bacterium]|nr:hypothetical protein [candidate division KSB1 bacterium]